MITTLHELRAEALFACDLQPSQHPSPEQVRRAVATVLRRHSSRWCAARMAEEFGEHPEAAAQRMCWARQVVRDCFIRPAPVRPTRCRATGGCARWTVSHGGWIYPLLLRRAHVRCPCSPGRPRRPQT